MKTIVKWSVNDYHQMIAAEILGDRRVELLEGEIIEMPPEGPLHRKITDSLAEYLREKLRNRAKIYEAHPITLPTSEPEPDLAIVSLPVSLYDNRHPYPEEIYWLVEIADNTLKKDLEEKRRVYARAGIGEYWVVEVQNKQVTVFRQPSDENYQFQQTYTQGTISPLAFPDLKVPLERILSRS